MGLWLHPERQLRHPRRSGDAKFAHVLYLLLRKAGNAKLDQRSIEYLMDKREA
jgi:hypothetical protein